MKISEKDRNLLILLAIVIVFAAYYFLVLTPQENKLNELKVQLEQSKIMKSEIDNKISSIDGIISEISSIERQIQDITKDYYSDLTNEELLMLLNSFGKEYTFSIKNLNVLKSTDAESVKDQYLVEVGYSGNYYSLIGYLLNVASNQKEIIIKGIEINKGEELDISGLITLEFNSFPLLKDFTSPYTKLIASKESTRDNSLGPFNPYEGFVSIIPVEEEVPIDEVEVIEDYEDYRPKVMIYGFEDGSSFFVGNSKDIDGNVTRSKDKISGGYSSAINFNFGMQRELSIANIVFDLNPIMLNKEAEYIGLWVNSEEITNHKIGIALIDSNGREYEVELTQSIDWTGWKEIEAMLPTEISYPCMVQRVYFEAQGYDQDLTGSYLVDQLEISYPVEEAVYEQ